MPSPEASCSPGGTIVEGTAGNTGIGLSVVAKCSWLYKTVIVIPGNAITGKEGCASPAGGKNWSKCQLHPIRNPNNFVRYSQRLAKALAQSEKNGAIWANQFDNTGQSAGSCRNHGDKRSGRRQTGGSVDGFHLCGGQRRNTLAGVVHGASCQKPRHSDRPRRSHGSRPL